MFAQASLLTAFLAGSFALFAPCCIGFLLPSYLGTVFKERRRILALTGIFTLGIFAVFLPIGLGIGAVGSLLMRFHDPFFYLGSAMLVVFGLGLLLGKMPMFRVPTPRLRGRTPGAVFAFGIFSGIGSSCCAPVFAGVATLSALSGTAAGGAILAASYVLGMVAPLFLLSWALDRTRVLRRVKFLQRPVRWHIGRLQGETFVSYCIAGAMFVGAGALIAWLTASGRAMSAVTWRESVQTGWAAKIAQGAPWLAKIPDDIWFVVFGVIIVAIIASVWRERWKDEAPA